MNPDTYLIEVFHNGEIRKEKLKEGVYENYHTLISTEVGAGDTVRIENLETFAKKVKKAYSRPSQPRFPHFPMDVYLLHDSATLALEKAVHGGKICVATEQERPFDYSQETQAYLTARIKDGHESLLEHITLTWECTGASRALLQQLARHRHISLSVQSTRWALKRTLGKKGAEPDWIIPPALDIRNTENAGSTKREDAQIIKDWLEVTHNIIQIMTSAYGNDTAKYFIPECAPTHFLVTANLREWRYIIKLRTQPNVLPEFQEFCHRIVDSLEYSLLTTDKILGRLLLL